MKKIVNTLLLAFVIGFIAKADFVPVDVAKQIAQNQYAENFSDDFKNFPELTLCKTEVRNNTILYYIFDAGKSGFVVIAADDHVYPVLGYSYERNYSESMDNLPPQFITWMENYADQIEDVVQKQIPATDEIISKWTELKNPATIIKETKDVDPLISSNWDQGAYYNAQCPEDPDGPDGHVWAGCVATAMGQVMKYYDHPNQGTGSHSYYSVDYGYISADFGATTYNWSSMPDQLYSYNTDVATLLFHLGVSVDMQYGPDGSGAYTSDARDALVNYFSYSQDATFLCKSNYPNSTWETMLKDQLDAEKPLVYQGSGPDGGHAWVCDGYQEPGYFHFNWGWSGYANGYYYLSNLNPGGSNFTENQCAIFEVYPDGTGSLAPPQNLTAEVINGNDIQLVWESPGSQEWIQWDAGSNTGNGIGLTNGGTFLVASRWSPPDLMPYDGMSIEKISFFPNEDATATFVLKAWTGNNAATQIMSQDIASFNVDQFNEVQLINPIVIDASQELWFGYEVTHGAGTFPAGCDDGPAIQEYGDQISLDGSSWTGMSAAYGLDYNWNLAAYVVFSDVDNPAVPMVKTINHKIAEPDFENSGSNTKSLEIQSESNKALLGYNVYRDGNYLANTTEVTYLDENLPGGTIEYYVTAVYDEGESGPSNLAIVYGPPTLDPPSNLIATIDDCQINLSWDSPGGPSEWMQWDAGTNTGNGIGLTNGGTFMVASRWTPSDLQPYNGMSVTKMMFYPNEDPDAIFVLKIWIGNNAGTEVMSQNVTSFIVNEFNEVILTNPVEIDASQEHWFGYEVTHDAGTYPAGCDDGPAVQELGDMISLDGTSWAGMSAAYGLDYNWNIAAFVEYTDVVYPTQLLVKTTIQQISPGSFVLGGSGSVVNKFIPEKYKSILGYNVYRDGAFITFIAGTTYNEDLEPCAAYTFYVTAVYDEGESLPSNEVFAEIPCYPPQNLEASVVPDSHVHLECEFPVCGNPSVFNFYRDGNLIGINGMPYFDDPIPSSGTYDYHATVNWGETESESSNIESVMIDPIFIESNKSINQISILPNPASDFVKVKSRAKLYSLQIYDITGEEIYAEFVNHNTQMINTSVFESGLYLFRIETETGSAVRRVVVK